MNNINGFKRVFDLFISCIGLLLILPILVLFSITIFTFSGLPIFFHQKRTGKNGESFTLYKFRSMYKNADKIKDSSITIENDNRITNIGKCIRKWKFDELPTLWNVLKGDMSLVGPRPDVPGYADKLEGEDRRILKLRPGITGLATLKYADEERLLATVDDPIKYNDEVIFPDKVKINLEYLDNWSLWLDIKIIFQTIFRSNY